MSIEDRILSLEDLVPANSEVEISGALIRQIADLSPVSMIVALMADFRIIYANAAAHRAAQIPANALIGRIATTAFAFVNPDLLAAKTTIEALAVACRDRDTTIWWDVSYVPLADGAAETTAVLITAVDVRRHETARG